MTGGGVVLCCWRNYVRGAHVAGGRQYGTFAESVGGRSPARLHRQCVLRRPPSLDRDTILLAAMIESRG